MATPRTFVEAPTVTPLPFGLLTAATVLEDGPDHWEMGTQYEPEFCGPAYDTEGACIAAPDFGTLTVSVDDEALATLDVTGNPAGDYTIDWGEGDPVEDATPDGATHSYGAPGDYTVTVTGPDGYTATAVITVEDEEASGPFDATVQKLKQAEEGVGLVTGVPFAVYHMFKCGAVGGYDRGAERARRALMGGEGRAVERVMGQLLAADDTGVDITPTPGTAVSIVDGIAKLEKWSAANYGGVATIHMPRDVALVAYAAGALVRVSTRLETGLGSRVAAGAGYDTLQGPDGAGAAGADEAWLYVTGQVVARRGAVIEVGPQLQTAPRDNSFLALAERSYVLTTECIVGAILVSTLDPENAGGGVDGGTP